LPEGKEKTLRHKEKGKRSRGHIPQWRRGKRIWGIKKKKIPGREITAGGLEKKKTPNGEKGTVVRMASKKKKNGTKRRKGPGGGEKQSEKQQQKDSSKKHVFEEEKMLGKVGGGFQKKKKKPSAKKTRYGKKRKNLKRKGGKGGRAGGGGCFGIVEVHQGERQLVNLMKGRTTGFGGGRRRNPYQIKGKTWEGNGKTKNFLRGDDVLQRGKESTTSGGEIKILLLKEKPHKKKKKKRVKAPFQFEKGKVPREIGGTEEERV